METAMRTIQYKFEGFDEVHHSEEWCLESAIEETRSRLAIPIWIDYKIIEDAHPEPHPDLTTYLSNVCNSTEPTDVPKRTRKAKAKPQATNVSTVLNVLGDTNPHDLIPEPLRDKMGRSHHPFSPSVPKRDDV